MLTPFDKSEELLVTKHQPADEPHLLADSHRTDRKFDPIRLFLIMDMSDMRVIEMKVRKC